MNNKKHGYHSVESSRRYRQKITMLSDYYAIEALLVSLSAQQWDISHPGECTP